MPSTSPFLTPAPTANVSDLSILHLRRDQFLPTVLFDHDPDNQGYAEGKVTNTRFGSYPHSTLIGRSWGSQVLASVVDTGTRGRLMREKRNNKRKQDEAGITAEDSAATEGDVSGTSTPTAASKSHKAPVAAASGFIHLMPPTPESWTLSLPHRTQVVYTPDYSYVLHRLRVRPGSVIIEAGSGSGSFTHASARAVFNGYPSDNASTNLKKKRKLGKVYSFEYHEQRFEKVKEEMEEHGLDGIVQCTHRNIYEDGFLVSDTDAPSDSKPNISPNANAIFLDVPAPWLAIPHLTHTPADNAPSPLNPKTPTHICCFSPCIEQVTQTVTNLRKHAWLDISMVEIQHKRIEVRRERIGIDEEGRGAMTTPATVEESFSRLRDVEERAKVFQENQRIATAAAAAKAAGSDEKFEIPKAPKQPPRPPKEKTEPEFRTGRLVHRTEPEIKTHTSYLTFAVLPAHWTDEMEMKTRAKIEAAVAKAKMEKEAQLKKKAALNGANGQAEDSSTVKAEEATADVDIKMEVDS